MDLFRGGRSGSEVTSQHAALHPAPHRFIDLLRGHPSTNRRLVQSRDAELLHHYQALVRIDTTDPPGNETRAVEYIQQVLEAEGIPAIVTAKDPARAA
jgi:hypothetical protein